MSIDRYYTQMDSKWVRFDIGTVNDNGDYILDEEVRDFTTDFWVDVCWGGSSLIDERYYFHDLGSALDFYTEGWRGRQFLLDAGEPMGIDHAGLYSRARLIHGLSIHGDAPGHEGENLASTMGAFIRHLNGDKKSPKGER